MSKESVQFIELARQGKYIRTFEIFCDQCRAMMPHTVSIRNGHEYYTCQKCGRVQVFEEAK